MFKACVKTIFLSVVLSGSAFAEVDLKKSAASLRQASFVLTNYGEGNADRIALQKAEKTIERAWEDFLEYQGASHPLAKNLSLIHARTVTATKRTKKIVPAWKGALQRLPISLASAKRINLYTEAANAAALAEDFRAAREFYAVARSLAVAGADNKDKAQLYMRLHELKATGQGMNWRPLRDALSDLRKASEVFALWSIPRLDALLGEAEIRVAHQPEKPEKRTDLAELKAQLVLAQKGMDSGMPAGHLSRLRSLFYVLEDNWRL